MATVRDENGKPIGWHPRQSNGVAKERRQRRAYQRLLDSGTPLGKGFAYSMEIAALERALFGQVRSEEERRAARTG